MTDRAQLAAEEIMTLLGSAVGPSAVNRLAQVIRKHHPEGQKEPFCGRCGAANIDRNWDTRVSGSIDLSCPSQAFAKLCGVQVAEKQHHDAWSVGHPAMTANEAQHVAFVWGPDASTRYRLCADCQYELMALIGKFFGYGAQVGVRHAG